MYMYVWRWCEDCKKKAQLKIIEQEYHKEHKIDSVCIAKKVDIYPPVKLAGIGSFYDL